MIKKSLDYIFYIKHLLYICGENKVLMAFY